MFRSVEHLPTWIRVLLGYYLATPVFLLFDLMLGWDFRVAFFADPLWKAAYYAVLFGCMALCLIRPMWSAVIGLVESSVNLLVHFVSFMLPIVTLPSQVLEQAPASTPPNINDIAGFLLVGTMLIGSVRAGIAALHRQG
jgi:hypothetical protein